MNPQWTSMLTAGGWVALAAVPPLVIALYFLKLKRARVEVPSTYLWRKSIEDLHANSLWQRLRRSLLLLLQMLMVALVMLALARPHWAGAERTGSRAIFLIDNSASMRATDVESSRLAEAKHRALALVDGMNSGDAAMVVAFANSAQVMQSFTTSAHELRRAIEAIAASDKTTSLDHALRLIAGLARSGTQPDAQRSSEPVRLFIFSDGRFPDVPQTDALSASLADIELIYVPIGRTDCENAGIVGMELGRQTSDSQSQQLFARVENFGTSPVERDVSLYRDGELVDAAALDVPPGKSQPLSFDVEASSGAVLELRLDGSDALRVDDRAWVVVPVVRRSRVLLVSRGNEPLELALRTRRAQELADVRVEPPGFVETDAYRTAAASGEFDLVIFDRAQPREMPAANTLFIAALPGDSRWKALPAVRAPGILDTLAAHPLMHLVDMSDVLIAQATPLEGPPGSQSLIDSEAGPLLVVAPRGGFEDAVLGFELLADGQAGSNWPVRLSFPMFVMRVLEHLGLGQAAIAPASFRPGQVVTLRLGEAGKQIAVLAPDGQQTTAARQRDGSYHISGADRVGLYRIEGSNRSAGAFAVNLLSPAESALRVDSAREIRVGESKLAAVSGGRLERYEIWKWLAAGALAILLFEWYIYNRRAYI